MLQKRPDLERFNTEPRTGVVLPQQRPLRYLGCSAKNFLFPSNSITPSSSIESVSYLIPFTLKFVHALSIRISQLNQRNRPYALFEFWYSARTTYSVDASGLRDREIEARDSYPEISLAARISS